MIVAAGGMTIVSSPSSLITFFPVAHVDWGIEDPAGVAVGESEHDVEPVLDGGIP